MPAKGRRAGRQDDPALAERAWLESVAQTASRDSGAPAHLLGDYLGMLATATIDGKRPRPQELRTVGRIGREAAGQGIPPGRVVDLYLSAAWRAWRHLPTVKQARDSEAVRAAAEAVLRVVDDAVASLVDGYQAERRNLIRREEALRRELVDDLLRGDADVARLVERAEPFGIELGLAHQIVLGRAQNIEGDNEAAVATLETAMLDLFGDRNVLVTTKDGLVVVLAPADEAKPVMARREANDVALFVHSRLTRVRRDARWWVSAGRAYPGAYGIARSYEEAREALLLADRLQSPPAIMRARDLLIYRVLIRDHAAISDLIDSVLAPLTQARDGAEPLLQTLEAYFAAGEVATEAARRLHLSVRAVTYRLRRVRTLTGYDPNEPAERFTLHTAVLGARLLGWPHGDSLERPKPRD